MSGVTLIEGAGAFETGFDKIVDLSDMWALSEFDTADAGLVPDGQRDPPLTNSAGLLFSFSRRASAHKIQ
jgi:hypothetical protein